MLRKSLLYTAFFVLLAINDAVAQTPTVAPSNKPLGAKDIARNALPSVVLLICDDPVMEGVVQGSGFFIKPGILVTNYHVIKGNKRGVVQVALGNNKEKRNFRIATIIAYDEASDLALLSVPGAKEAKVPYLFLVLENESVEVGESIYALGNPEGLVGTISPGIISASLRSSDKKARLQITAPISHGSSGGPVLNEKGAVVGVAVGSLAEGQNLNFAVPTALVYALLTSAKFPDRLDDYIDLSLENSAKTPANWVWSSKQPGDATTTVPTVSVIGPVRVGETEEIASLRKLKGVYVLVEGLSPDGRKILDEKQLQTEVELTLRRNRIRVLTTSEWFSSIDAGKLYLNLNVLQGNSGLFSYGYSLELNQKVRLDRDPAFKMESATWRKAGTGLVGSTVAARAIREAVASLVDEFCNDFLKANSP